MQQSSRQAYGSTAESCWEHSCNTNTPVNIYCHLLCSHLSSCVNHSFIHLFSHTSVVLLVINERLRLLCEFPLHLHLLFQSCFCFLTLIDFHSRKRQTQHKRLQCQDVQQHRHIIQSLSTHEYDNKNTSYPLQFNITIPYASVLEVIDTAENYYNRICKSQVF